MDQTTPDSAETPCSRCEGTKYIKIYDTGGIKLNTKGFEILCPYCDGTGDAKVEAFNIFKTNNYRENGPYYVTTEYYSSIPGHYGRRGGYISHLNKIEGKEKEPTDV